jgi:hypothetical protein
MIVAWNPDFVITMGDNNYTNNSTTTGMDNAIGALYGQYIKYPSGSTSTYAPGPAVNKFFPCLGNHDWDAGISGWNNYFDLPDNERYYEFVQGPVHFIVIDSDTREPDGTSSSSTQAVWLQGRLGVSSSRWKIVYFHHPPYSSGTSHGNSTWMQWPFQTLGATAVLAGHEHNYERILKDGFPYFVNGSGGKSLYGFKTTPEPGSVVCYNDNYGAMLIEANYDSVTFKFYSISGGAGGTLIDAYTIKSSPPVTVEDTLVSAGSTWKYLDNGSDQGPAWYGMTFNDGSWQSGPAELGYGDGDEATVVSYGPNSNSKYITTYFRHSFNVVDTAVYMSLSLSVLRDDGAVVYLNGAEVFRTNMPSGSISYTTQASSAVGDPNEDNYFSTSVDPSKLRNGTNVLAVEIHQRSGNSSDISFNLKLTGTMRASPACVNTRVMLEGPFGGGSMSTTLRTAGYIPASQPYNTAPWNYMGTESVASIPAGVVDWVLMQLRSNTTTTVASRAAFVKSDGSVVDLDGVSPVAFPNLAAGNYYVVVRHRNHLAIMSANPVALSESSGLYDFSTAQNKAYGTEPMRGLGSGNTAPFALYAGDATGDGQVNASDRSGVDNNLNLTGFMNADVSLDGQVNATDRSRVDNSLNRVSNVP